MSGDAAPSGRSHDAYVDDRLASIELAIAETQKLRAESAKLVAEGTKLIAESTKLLSEGRKLDRDRVTATILATAAVVGAAATFGGVVVKVLGG